MQEETETSSSRLGVWRISLLCCRPARAAIPPVAWLLPCSSVAPSLPLPMKPPRRFARRTLRLPAPRTRMFRLSSPSPIRSGSRQALMSRTSSSPVRAAPSMPRSARQRWAPRGARQSTPLLLKRLTVASLTSSVRPSSTIRSRGSSP